MNESQAMPINLIAPSSEHAPKRWYQLSLLQLLVAMAVVAVFVQLNCRITRTVPFPSIGDAVPIQGAYLGWPFSYRFELVSSETDDAQIEWSSLDCVSLAKNVATGLGIALATIAILGGIQKRGRNKRPSPSTQSPPTVRQAVEP